MGVDTSHLDNATEDLGGLVAFQPAMTILNEADAEEYLRALVSYASRLKGWRRKDSEAWARKTLTWYAATFDQRTYHRVRRLFAKAEVQSGSESHA